MVTLLVDDMREKGYLDQREYLESDGAEIAEAEVIDEEYVEQESDKL